jgi:protein SCO1/2
MKDIAPTETHGAPAPGGMRGCFLQSWNRGIFFKAQKTCVLRPNVGRRPASGGGQNGINPGRGCGFPAKKRLVRAARWRFFSVLLAAIGIWGIEGRSIAVDSTAPSSELAHETFESLPNVSLINENGAPVRFFTDLVQGKTVVINFLFTGCSTVCPVTSANFAALEKSLPPGDDTRLISISVDPGEDTPERLKRWKEQFHGGGHWTLLTGSKREVDLLLKALRAFVPDKVNHTSLVLVGNGREWKRLSGLGSVESIARVIAEIRDAAMPKIADRSPSLSSPAQRYFPDLPLLDQNGKQVRFYSDLLKGKTVVINTFFRSCGGTCPLTMTTLSKVQDRFQDRIGKDLWILCISVDPGSDTPETLKAYAANLKAGDGWLFLTGDKTNVEAVLKKLGQYVDDREKHSNILIVGNEPTGLWKKVFGLAPPNEAVDLIGTVLNDSSSAPQQTASPKL